MAIITLTTDFGHSSPYVAAMKGVILSIHPQATVVDITHAIPAQDVRAAAVVLDDVTEYFPEGTIHVVVVDPGVGTERAILYAEVGTQRYLAPDNGVLSHILSRRPAARLLLVTESKWFRQPVSRTFHGRDIFAPVAAHLGLGLDPSLLGPQAGGPTLLPKPEVQITPSRIHGVVQAVDSFGNLITNITAEMLAGRPTDRRACIVFGIFETWGIHNT
ncbi:MAG: SAM hydrolase/SAM-dependent halogenase family protein, partial [Planctomycetota bacterium]